MILSSTPAILSAELLEARIAPAVVFGLTDTQELYRFESDDPTAIVEVRDITGLTSGETLVGIDFRPADLSLVGLGSNGNLYRLNTATGAATKIGTGAGVLNGLGFTTDFNPVSDRLRVVSDTDVSLRLDPNTGGLAGTDTPVAFAAGDPNAPENPLLLGAAYTNNFAGATTTTLYAIDFRTDSLVLVGGLDGSPSPNGGVLTTVGELGLLIDLEGGFDIAQNGEALAALRPLTENFSSLYTIDLATGEASLLGSIGGNGASEALILDLAIAPAGGVQFFTPTFSVTENGLFGQITLSRVGGAFGEISATLVTSDGTALAGEDYTTVSESVTFADGETLQTIFVPLFDDAINEPEEALNLTLLGDFLGTDDAATLRITDDNTAPLLNFATTDFVYEGSQLLFEVVLNAPSTQVITVNFSTSNGTALAGVDYLAASGTLTFERNATRVPIAITTLEDTLGDGNKTFTLTLSAPTNATLPASPVSTITILDDEVRLVNPRTATFTDVDGDLVTISVSRGTLLTTDFDLSGAGIVNGFSLNTIDFANDERFTGARLSITARPVGGQGDGLVNVGAINASGVDLGAVSVAGDLGTIDAGDVNTATTGLASLTVRSLGRAQAFGSGDSSSDILGRLGALNVKTDIFGASIFVSGGFDFNGSPLPDAAPNGRIGAIRVGGSLEGVFGNFDGSIQATGDIVGPVTVGGDLIGAFNSILGTGFGSGSIQSDGSILGSVRVGGSLRGSDAEQSASISADGGSIAAVTIGRAIEGGSISAFGSIRSVKIGTELRGDIVSNGALGSLTVGADVEGGSVFSGRIGQVTIGGSLRAASAIFSETTIDSLLVRGDFAGSSIEARGNALPTSAAQAVAIRSVTILGDMEFSQIRAGVVFDEAAGNPDAQIGTVRITGDFLGSEILAGGGNSGPGEFEQIPAGTGFSDNAAIFSRIASITISGQARTEADFLGIFTGGISAQQLGAVKIGATSLKLTSGPDLFFVGATLLPVSEFI